MEKIRIGEKIRLLRRKNDVTQDQLAAYLGVTPQAVSRWESGICYPDMGTLPAIADYFSVNMDELLCYTNNQKRQREQAYLEQADRLLDSDRVVEALEVLRNAMAEMPSSDAIRLETAQVLSLYAQMVAQRAEARGGGERNAAAASSARAAVQAALGEAVSLCRHILEDSTDDRLRDETRKTLCDIYAHQLGDGIQALELADQFHSMAYSQEIIKATVLTGDVAFRQAQENLILFADNIWWHLYNLACVPDISGDRYTVGQKIAILKKGMDIFSVIFEDTPLFYADRLANSCHQLALLYLTEGDRDTALSYLERMAEYAMAFDRRPDSAIYPSVVIDQVVCQRQESADARQSKCARLLRSLSAGRAYQPLRGEPRFQAVLDRMAACAGEEKMES